MNLPHPIDLMMRRVGALALDLAILLIFLGLCCVVAVAGQVNCIDPGWNPVLLGILLCYFGVFESFWSGQTPGKCITGIRLETTTHKRLAPFQAFARVSLVLLSPVAAVLLYQLLGICHVIPQSVHLAHPFLLAVSCTIWPISGAIGKGHVGMHDLLLHTRVTRIMVDDTWHHSGVGPLYPWAVVFITVAISFLFVHTAFGSATSTVVDYFDRITGEERLELMRLAQSTEDLPLRIENGPEFMRGDSAVWFIRWTSDIWKEWEVKRSCVVLPNDIREGQLRFRVHAKYVIPVTNRGLSSGVFQQIVVRDICQRAMRQNLFVTVEFVHTSQMWTFVAITKKRYLAFPYEQTGKEGRVSTGIYYLEPDDSIVLRLGVGFGDFTATPTPL